MAAPSDTEHMARAVALASRGAGTTSPNPVVGCVVVAPSGEVVGEGWHARAGGPHAEVVALAEAGERARGGTAYVTLEPCRHTGRTGPCSEALREAGVARVVVAVADPTGLAGGGAEQLRSAGVEVETGVGAEAAEHGNRHWLTTARTGRPFVVLKTASTLDGRIAAADGSSRWITGPQARAEVHSLRARHDAVLVGAGTLRADDPHLAVRGIEGARQPLRVVLDPRAEIGRGARVLDSAAPTLVVVATSDPGSAAADRADALRAAGVDVLAVATDSRGRLDLRAVLEALAGRGVVSVLVEGGPTLAGALVAADLVDEVVTYLAPALLGAGPSALGPAGVATIAEAVRLTVTDLARVGPDVRLEAQVLRRS